MKLKTAIALAVGTTALVACDIALAEHEHYKPKLRDQIGWSVGVGGHSSGTSWSVGVSKPAHYPGYPGYGHYPGKPPCYGYSCGYPYYSSTGIYYVPQPKIVVQHPPAIVYGNSGPTTSHGQTVYVWYDKEGNRIESLTPPPDYAKNGNKDGK